jgi:hypothetical protein
MATSRAPKSRAERVRARLRQEIFHMYRLLVPRDTQQGLSVHRERVLILVQEVGLDPTGSSVVEMIISAGVTAVHHHQHRLTRPRAISRQGRIHRLRRVRSDRVRHPSPEHGMLITILESTPATGVICIVVHHPGTGLPTPRSLPDQLTGPQQPSSGSGGIDVAVPVPCGSPGEMISASHHHERSVRMCLRGLHRLCSKGDRPDQSSGRGGFRCALVSVPVDKLSSLLLLVIPHRARRM